APVSARVGRLPSQLQSPEVKSLPSAWSPHTQSAVQGGFATAAGVLFAAKTYSKEAPRWSAGRAGSQAEAPPGRRRWKGAAPVPTAISVSIGLIIRFLCPVPEGVSTQGWSILALFVATVAGIVTQPLPSPGVAFCALAVGLMTKTLAFAEGVAAFTDEVLWLVLLAFFFTKGFAKTGLGDRIALSIVRLVGGTTLGLAYGLNAAEGVLAAGMPSSAARAAGVFYPLADSVAKACGSDPAKNLAKNTGGFLVQSAFQATGNSSSLWLYGAAQNLLALRLAGQLGYVVPSPFTSWLKASCVPALTAMALTPLVTFWALPPEVKQTPDAPKEAQRKLQQMGAMKTDEAILASVILGMLVLWACSSTLGIPAVHTAVLGLAVLLLTGVLTWTDCAGEKGAWTTMTWFAILVSMSAMLNKLGIVRWLAGSISAKITAAGLSGCPAFLALLTVYVFSHYVFASQVAHLSAMYLPFIVMMVETGTPPMVAVFSLAFASNIFGSMTPYSSAQAPVFFGGNYVSLKDWYRLGLIFILFNMVVWVGVGAIWWKVIGLY
ncbi:DIT2-1, partial [Symbiodinium pilosum]